MHFSLLVRTVHCIQGVGLSFCVWRPGPFFKDVLRPEVIIFGILRPPIFRRLRPKPNFYGVLRLTVLWRLASGVKIHASGVVDFLK